MDNEQLAKLAKIGQLDLDAKLIYVEAAKRIDAEDGDIRESFQIFSNDHQRHVKDICELIIESGDEPPDFSPDIKGRTIEGMIALISAIGSHAVLKVMQQNEKLTGKAYADVISDPEFEGYPGTIQLLLKDNFRDEQRHLVYINESLEKQLVAR